MIRQQDRRIAVLTFFRSYFAESRTRKAFNDMDTLQAAG
jgi:hypothetical protein